MTTLTTALEVYNALYRELQPSLSLFLESPQVGPQYAVMNGLLVRLQALLQVEHESFTEELKLLVAKVFVYNADRVAGDGEKWLFDRGSVLHQVAMNLFNSKKERKKINKKFQREDFSLLQVLVKQAYCDGDIDIVVRSFLLDHGRQFYVLFSDLAVLSPLEAKKKEAALKVLQAGGLFDVDKKAIFLTSFKTQVSHGLCFYLAVLAFEKYPTLKKARAIVNEFIDLSDDDRVNFEATAMQDSINKVVALEKCVNGDLMQTLADLESQLGQDYGDDDDKVRADLEARKTEVAAELQSLRSLFAYPSIERETLDLIDETIKGTASNVVSQADILIRRAEIYRLQRHLINAGFSASDIWLDDIVEVLKSVDALYFDPTAEESNQKSNVQFVRVVLELCSAKIDDASFYPKAGKICRLYLNEKVDQLLEVLPEDGATLNELMSAEDADREIKLSGSALRESLQEIKKRIEKLPTVDDAINPENDADKLVERSVPFDAKVVVIKSSLVSLASRAEQIYQAQFQPLLDLINQLTASMPIPRATVQEVAESVEVAAGARGRASTAN